MITVPSLDPCTDIENTDKVMITHANGTTETITGELLNKRNQVIIASTKTLTGTPLKTGNVVRVLFNAGQSAADGNTAMVINYNSSNKTVKVCKNGALTNYLPFEVSTGVYKYCQAYTTLELLYDGTNFIIIGNPVVLSGTDFTIFADGLKRVSTYNPSDKSMITSSAVKQALDENIPIPTDAVLHYSFDDMPDYPDGTAIEKHIKDFTSVPSGWNTNNKGVLSVANGEFVNTISGTNPWIRRNFSTPTSGIVKVKIRATIDCTVIALQYYDTTYTNLAVISDAKANQVYTLTAFMPSTSYLLAQAVSSVSTDFQLIISEIYIGDGSYSTPIIDNSNGEFNATNNGGISVQGVSGKGVNIFPAKPIVATIPEMAGDLSVSVWSKNNGDAGNYPTIADQYTTSRDNLNWRIYYNNQAGTIITSKIGSVYCGNVTITAGWHHFVLTIQGTTAKLYVDGVLGGTSENVTGRIIGSTLRIGSTQNSYLFNGIVDDLLIFDRALTEQEVKALYLNKANTPKYYTLNDYKLAKKLPPPPTTDGNYTLKVNVASGVETYSWV